MKTLTKKDLGKMVCHCGCGRIDVNELFYCEAHGRGNLLFRYFPDKKAIGIECLNCLPNREDNKRLGIKEHKHIVDFGSRSSIAITINSGRILCLIKVE